MESSALTKVSAPGRLLLVKSVTYLQHIGTISISGMVMVDL